MRIALATRPPGCHGRHFGVNHGLEHGIHKGCIRAEAQDWERMGSPVQPRTIYRRPSCFASTPLTGTWPRRRRRKKGPGEPSSWVRHPGPLRMRPREYQLREGEIRNTSEVDDGARAWLAAAPPLGSPPKRGDLVMESDPIRYVMLLRVDRSPAAQTNLDAFCCPTESPRRAGLGFPGQWATATGRHPDFSLEVGGPPEPTARPPVAAGV